MEGQKPQRGTDLGRGLSKWAEAENGKENKSRVQEFMAAWDSEGSTIMLSSFKKKNWSILTVLDLCCMGFL